MKTLVFPFFLLNTFDNEADLEAAISRGRAGSSSIPEDIRVISECGGIVVSSQLGGSSRGTVLASVPRPAKIYEAR